MIFRLHHATRYGYGSTVDLASHILHLSPREFAHQRVLSSTIVSDPQPARRTNGTDHFGNGVTWLFLERPHTGFSVICEAVVDVHFPAPPEAGATPAWEEVARLAREGRASSQHEDAAAWQAAEFVFDSPMLPHEPLASDYASATFTPGRPVLEALLELNTRIRRDFTFRAGVTTISTPVREVMAKREGVCQDFSHLMIAALRGLGLPARYVSGYIRTRPRPGTTRLRGADQSHAWVGCWLGPDHGWVDLDPTNGLVVHEEHVVLGWGRDYGDVSPVRGIILGGGSHGLSVSVDLEPEGESAR